MAATQVAAEEDLDALFDTMSDDRQREIMSAHAAPVVASNTAVVADVNSDDATAAVGPDGMYNRIGNLTRQLHEALRELGFDKALESAAAEIPDARDRLGYIAKLTGQAADRALAAVEVSQNEQRQLHEQACKLSSQWELFFGGDMKIEDFRSLAHESRIFMMQTQSRAEATQHQLTEIMMAQDFHDLTGQVINRLSSLVQKMEDEMVKLLIETVPSERRQGINSSDLEGPQVSTAGRTDVVTDQIQVDDLLESLGF
ncbi:MAG: protein phosphatase CheZ [Burkholderiales bacterium]